ncbi:MAG: ribonuclease P protein component [Schleiferiaceae bacterium]|nr:ribonuclease P protein component [Schleiferiaceae bacterium]
MKHALPKSQRLRGKQNFQKLFAEGAQKAAYPVALRYRWTPAVPGVRMAVGVSRRRFKHAADRNRLKRRLREAYRTQQECFPQDTGLELLFIYMPHHEVPYVKLERAVAQLARELHNAHPPPAL